MNNDKNFNSVSDISSKFASSSLIKNDEKYRYEYYENIYFSDERN